MRTAIFGGSFDPVHIGHLLIAESARAAFSLDRIIFMPANISPHKYAEGNGERASASISAEARCALLRAALQDNPYFEISTHELERGGVSYTIDTLLAFGAREDAPVYCLIGADLAPRLGEWHRPQELARLARFIAVTREGKVPEAPPPFSLERFDSPGIDVSSTMIRERIASGRSVRYLVPDAVEALIRERGYYGAGGERG